MVYQALDWMNVAQQQVQAGRWAEAETAFRQALAQQPNQPTILFWLGLTTAHLGKLEDSVAFYQQALAQQPQSVETLSNLATVLLKLGRAPEALTYQRQCLAIAPQDPNVHYNLGILLYGMKWEDEALHHYQRAIELDPSHVNSHVNLAMIWHQRGEFEAAVAGFQQALTLAPDHAAAYNGLGVSLYRLNQLDEAIAQYQRAIALNPHYPSAHNNLGTAYKQQGKLAEAQAQYEQAIALKPDYASAYDNLGTVFQEQGDLEGAIAHYRQALTLRPNYANAHSNLGTALREQGDLETAMSHYQEAIRLDPHHADAYNNYGGTLIEMGRLQEAIGCYEQAVLYRPDHADAHLNLGITLLMLGDYRRGFIEYHWRWKTKQCPSLRYPQALWDGSDLTGKVILLTAEQGFGDTIQFARYAPLVAQRSGARVLVACQKPLLRLLSTLQGVECCLDRNTAEVETNVHAPLLDLPLLLGTTLETIPADIPYLQPPATRDLVLPVPPTARLKVGMVWAANPANSTSTKRSCTLQSFLRLLQVPGLALYSLQKDLTDADRTWLAHQTDICDLSEQLQDFADTAAAIAQLDLVITVDTAVAHLAGALGKPTWTLLPAVADWRWLRDRTDTPWYPTMRLFRQAQAGDWEAVFTDVISALTEVLHASEPVVQPSQQECDRTLPDSSCYLDNWLVPSSFNRLKRCRHGTFLYNMHDLYVGRSLEFYGEWSEGELELLRHLIQPGDVIVDAGANIGTHTVFFGQAVGRTGQVLAFEPQRLVFQTLCANVALNSLTNVQTYPLALGAAVGTTRIPNLDYRRVNNFGGVSVGEQFEGEMVQVVPLDQYSIPRCRLLKVDVEGAELAVLQGAEQTIRRCQPLVYLENDRPAQAVPLVEYLQRLGYDLYWHRPPLYNAHNYAQNTANIFGTATSFNMFGVHRNYGLRVNGMEPVKLSSVRT